MNKKVNEHIVQEYHLLNELFGFYRGYVSTSFRNRYNILKTYFDPVIDTDYVLFPGYEGNEWIEVYYESIYIPKVESSLKEVYFSKWPLINSYEEVLVEGAQPETRTDYRKIVLGFFSEEFLWESRLCLKELKSFVYPKQREYEKCLKMEYVIKVGGLL